MMAEPESKDLTTALSSRGQGPVVALVLILATTVGMLNLSTRPGGGPSPAEAAPKGTEPAGFARRPAAQGRCRGRPRDPGAAPAVPQPRRRRRARWTSSPGCWADTGSRP